MKRQQYKITIIDVSINLLSGVVILLLILLGVQMIPTGFANNQKDIKEKSLEQVKVIPTKSRLRLL